jgi:hypothetical protein
MNRLFFTLISVIVHYSFGLMEAGKSPHGFVVWSSGNHCEKELKYQRLEEDKGPVGEIKTAVKKGEGADIMVVISFDGKWIAFSRFIGTPPGRYGGPCDYHSFDKLDCYIARIDGALPAEPIKIAHGYWPSWGEDSKQAAKTLYFTNHSSQTIHKTTVNDDGSFTAPVRHATCRKIMKGINAHTQGSPNGKYIAYRPGGMKVQDIAAGKDIPGIGGGGCHPCWGPRSRYLIWAKNRVGIINGGQGMRLGFAGFGHLYFGISNDAEYDQGRLWAIGVMSGNRNSMNAMSDVVFKPIDITDNGWRPGPATKVASRGTWCDIHVGTIPTSTGQNPELYNGLDFKPIKIHGSNGLPPGIQLHGPDVYSAGLYNLQGQQKAFLRLLGVSPNTIPLRGTADGMYVIKLTTAGGSFQKAIRIVK